MSAMNYLGGTKMAILSAGTKVFYGVESTAGTVPTAGYVQLPGITELPDMNSQPETIETTPLDAEEYKEYIPGLKDTGGALALTANMTQALKEAWATCVEAFKTAKTADKAMWFMFDIPEIEDVFMFTGEPTPMGFAGASVNSALTTSLYVTPSNEPDWMTDPRA